MGQRILVGHAGYARDGIANKQRTAGIAGRQVSTGHPHLKQVGLAVVGINVEHTPLHLKVALLHHREVVLGASAPAHGACMSPGGQMLARKLCDGPVTRLVQFDHCKIGRGVHDHLRSVALFALAVSTQGD